MYVVFNKQVSKAGCKKRWPKFQFEPVIGRLIDHGPYWDNLDSFVFAGKGYRSRKRPFAPRTWKTTPLTRSHTWYLHGSMWPGPDDGACIEKQLFDLVDQGTIRFVASRVRQNPSNGLLYYDAFVHFKMLRSEKQCSAVWSKGEWTMIDGGLYCSVEFVTNFAAYRTKGSIPYWATSRKNRPWCTLPLTARCAEWDGKKVDIVGCGRAS